MALRGGGYNRLTGCDHRGCPRRACRLTIRPRRPHRTNRPTPARSIGQISPLVSQLGGGPQAGYATNYGNFLPRPTQDFQAGAFGPFSPIYPMAIDQPPDGAERAMPRRLPYQVGWNLPIGQPGTEGVKLCDFQTLRSLANVYSRSSRLHPATQVRDPRPRMGHHPHQRRSQSHARRPQSHGRLRRTPRQSSRILQKPRPRIRLLVIMARHTRLKTSSPSTPYPSTCAPPGAKAKDVLGSDLTALELIAGETIRPLFDLHGSRPRPPAPAFQQYLWGVPRVDLMQLITQADLTDELKAGQVAEYRGDQLLYMPYTRQTMSPYGLPPIEQALVPVMSGLVSSNTKLDFFREGSIPGMFISPGDVNMTPSQIRELQDALNALAGDVGFKHKIIVLPPGSKTDPQKPPDLATEFDSIVMYRSMYNS